MACMQDRGWRMTLQAGWLLMDAPIPPMEAQPVPPADGEAACCLWLLAHHPSEDIDTLLLRELVKAQDAGKQPLDRLCAVWHRHFAALLRNKRPLPGGLLPYLCRAIKEVQP